MTDNINLLKEKMFAKIASSENAHIKHLQIDEDDLTISEKYSCLEKLFEDKPSIFLERYYIYLDKKDIILFEKCKNLSMVEHYINQIKSNHLLKQNPKLKKYALKNKYYKILEKLIEEGDYFSDYEMKKRDPLLYDQMVGQYLDEAEITENAKLSSPNSFADNLINQLESINNDEHYDKQLENEKCITEEYDSDDSEGTTLDNDMTEEFDIKTILRKEFTAIMHQRFLEGLDDFNYGDYKYDHDPKLLEIINRDKEDAYFDEDDNNEDSDDMDTLSNHDNCLKRDTLSNDDNCLKEDTLSNDVYESYKDEIFIKNDNLNNEKIDHFKNNVFRT